MTTELLSLKSKINEDMKLAMKAKDAPRLSTIRLILTAVKQKEVDERVVVSDADLLVILDKMAKQRRESIKEFGVAGRQDLVDKEQFELSVIQFYMPTQLSTVEVETLVQEAIKNVAASSIKDMGKVMAILKPQIQGRADMGLVGDQIKKLLGA